MSQREDVFKGLNLFVDGRGHAGLIDEFTPPKLTIKTEEFRAGGMDVPVKHDMGMEAMEASASLQSYNKELFKLFGLILGDEVPVTARGSFDRGGTMVPVVINMRGRLTEVDEGAWKPGEKVSVKLKWDLTYYKRTQDGEVLQEIDALNMIRIIGGVDQLEEIRGNIGL